MVGAFAELRFGACLQTTGRQRWHRQGDTPTARAPPGMRWWDGQHWFDPSAPTPKLASRFTALPASWAIERVLAVGPYVLDWLMTTRWYDPATGEFLSVGPDFNETLCTYVYADENALDGADPFGLLTKDNTKSECGSEGWTC